MGSNAAGDDTLFDVVEVRQSEMLGRSDIAQEGSAVHRSDSASDGSGDVVVAGSDVGHQWTQHIERSAHADGLLHLHVGSNLVHRNVSGTLHHDLYILFPGTFGQLAQADQLFDLADVGGIGKAAGTAGIAQRDGDVILAADVQNLVVVFIEWIFLAGHAHPGKDQGAAAGNDIHFAFVLANLVDGLAGDAAVQGDKIHTVFCV